MSCAAARTNGDVFVPAQISLDGLTVSVSSSAPSPLALTVQYALPQVSDEGVPDGTVTGLVMLTTCLLPPGDRLLSLELARSRLMQFFNCQENWGQSELDESDQIMKLIRRAQQKFSESLTLWPAQKMQGAQSQAEMLAQESLALSMRSGELLAQRHALERIAIRNDRTVYNEAVARTEVATGEPLAGTNIPVKAMDGLGVMLPGVAGIGCGVSPGRLNDQTTALLTQNMDYVSVPMRWSLLEPKEGTYSFAATDKWIEWAVTRARIPVVSGAVIDFQPGGSPQWLSIWENDYETLRELVYEHVRHVVTRYRRTVPVWTVVSGIPANESFPLSYERMADLTRVCTTVVRRLHPRARIIVEIQHPWGEYAGVNSDSIGPLQYLQLLTQVATDFDMIGIQLGVGETDLPRDLMSISEMLDQYASFDKPVQVTGLWCPSKSTVHAGLWGSQWNETTQATWAADVMRICAGKLFVQSICWQDLVDASGEGCGVMNVNGGIRPVLEAIRSVRTSLRQVADAAS